MPLIRERFNSVKSSITRFVCTNSSALCVVVIPITFIPALIAASIPDSESSITTHSLGPIPRRLAVFKYISGFGLLFIILKNLN